MTRTRIHSGMSLYSFVLLAFLAFLITMGNSFAATSATTSKTEKLLYRHQDATGETVLEDELSPEAISRGYDVLTTHGAVIKHVPPPESEAELEKEAAQKALEAQKLKVQEEADLKQATLDHILLETYLAPSDVLRSRNEKIDALLVSIDIAKRNIEQLNQTIKKQDAALIKDSQRQITESTSFISGKEQELFQIVLQAHLDYTRLIELLNKKSHQALYTASVSSSIACTSSPDCKQTQDNLRTFLKDHLKATLYLDLSTVLLTNPTPEGFVIMALKEPSAASLQINVYCADASVKVCHQQQLQQQLEGIQHLYKGA